MPDTFFIHDIEVVKTSLTKSYSYNLGTLNTIQVTSYYNNQGLQTGAHSHFFLLTKSCAMSTFEDNRQTWINIIYTLAAFF